MMNRAAAHLVARRQHFRPCRQEQLYGPAVDVVEHHRSDTAGEKSDGGFSGDMGFQPMPSGVCGSGFPIVWRTRHGLKTRVTRGGSLRKGFWPEPSLRRQHLFHLLETLGQIRKQPALPHGCVDAEALENPCWEQ